MTALSCHVIDHVIDTLVSGRRCWPQNIRDNTYQNGCGHGASSCAERPLRGPLLSPCTVHCARPERHSARFCTCVSLVRARRAARLPGQPGAQSLVVTGEAAARFDAIWSSNYKYHCHCGLRGLG